LINKRVLVLVLILVLVPARNIDIGIGVVEKFLVLVRKCGIAAALVLMYTVWKKFEYPKNQQKRFLFWKKFEYFNFLRFFLSILLILIQKVYSKT
jgi:hypothetical protein